MIHEAFAQTVKQIETLTDEVVVHGRQRPRRPRLPQPRDAPRPWPDAAEAAVRDADETVAEAPDEGANIRSRGKLSAGDAVAVVAAATGMRPDKRPPSPASCRRLLLLLLVPLSKPAVASENCQPPLPESRQVGPSGTLLTVPMARTTDDNNSGHSPFSRVPTTCP